MSRGDCPPAVDDLTFQARPGEVTGLLGDAGAGKSTVLRLMLELEPGRGVTLFDGRPPHRLRHPAGEVGVLLGDVPGHPGRTARGHLRMLAAAFGVPAARAEDVLDIVGLRGLADQRLGTFSLGMDRRLGIAAALVADPRALLLDEPARGLSPRDSVWMYSLLRSYANQGGAVVVTGRDPKAMVRFADRIVTLVDGRLVADQPTEEFARTRLRPYVAVQTPHAERLVAVLADDGSEVTRSSGSRIAVYGTTAAQVGETAYRHRIMLHRLADEVADTGPVAPPTRADGRLQTDHAPAAPAEQSTTPVPSDGDAVPLPEPTWPLRYELLRFRGVRTSWLVAAATLLASLVATLVMLRTGGHASLRTAAGWAHVLPLPPAALGAGLLGALSYGQEFRYPALAPAQIAASRKLRLLAAKLVVSAGAALLLAGLAGLLGTAVLRFVLGPGSGALPTDRPAQVAGWAALTVGCAWSGLLAAGVFQTTGLGMAGVLTVPLIIAPTVGAAVATPAAGPLSEAPDGLRAATGGWPVGLGRVTEDVVRLASQPLSCALGLSLAILLCAYLAAVLSRRTG